MATWKTTTHIRGSAVAFAWLAGSTRPSLSGASSTSMFAGAPPRCERT
jgi:hypothetical protein